MSNANGVCGRFHHVGYATTDLGRECDRLRALGYLPEGEVFEDPAQGIRGLFLTGGGPRLELLEDLTTSGTLVPFVERGTVLYHLAYTCDDLESAGEAIRREAGAKLVRAPRAAVAFGGRRVSFYVLPSRLMVEFIES